MTQIIAGGVVVTEAAALPVDIRIDGGTITGLMQPGTWSREGATVIDAEGLLVFPGAVDVHTHFTGSHPRMLEEVREGTLGAAAGGVTTVAEMPHSLPPATTLEGFEAKRALFAANSSIDFALWAGLDGENLDLLPALDRAGAIAFKGFLCSADPGGRATDPSGLPRIGDDFLREAMRVICSFDGLVGLHSENHELLIGARQRLLAAGRHDARAHALSGPELAEIEAVSRVALFAAETGVRCHIVHVSSAKAAGLVVARRGNDRLSFETCPHYLLLDEDDLVRIGPNARCGPPLRPRTTVDALWQRVLAGEVDMLASDHCPYLPEQKTVGLTDIWRAGMGLTGVETAAPALFSEGVQRRGLALLDFARMTATAPAKAFGLYPRKGAIRIGADADLAFYDPKAEWTVRGADFHGLAKWSAFEGLTLRGRVVRTLVRGRSVYDGPSSAPVPGYGAFVTRENGMA